MKKLIMVALIAGAVSGCAQQSFSVNKGTAFEPQKVTTHHFFVSGIGAIQTNRCSAGVR
ncbi:Bor protein [Leclercia adecarboxylata]|uniref:Bor protein n=1 Tax=Leclercia adecarboxylata TaxID=83655 RepID=A0A4U9HVJ0_9ENTR|nr:Bor protein [Leclercia adecarboxylata]